MWVRLHTRGSRAHFTPVIDKREGAALCGLVLRGPRGRGLVPAINLKKHRRCKVCAAAAPDYMLVRGALLHEDDP